MQTPVPREQFNDDDLYVYRPDTLELLTVVPYSRRRLYQPPAEYAAKPGMAAKFLGLWRAA